MSEQQFTWESVIPVPREDAFAWHERPGAFDRLTPPWDDVKLIARNGTIHDGARATIELRTGPIKQRWVAEHMGFEQDRRFEDVQISGPFAAWHHRHEFQDAPDGGTLMRDEIEYRLPMSPLSDLVAGAFTRDKLRQMFHYRHETLAHDLLRHAAFPERKHLRVVISGASGLVGTALAAALQTGGHEVVRLVRRAPVDEHELQWNTTDGIVDPERIAGFDAVIHLAGAGIADERWTPERMKLIEESRTLGTRALVDSLRKASAPPAAFIAASAIGVYGNRGDEVLDEDSSFGEGFLVEVGDKWEAEIDRATEFGMRVAKLRLGLVLSPRGGLLAKLLPIFKIGGGGPIGSGKQYMSWISIDDVVWAFHRALVDTNVTGAINLTAPEPVTNATFTKALGKALSRPAFVPVPSFGPVLLFGKMAHETALSSARVRPTRLLDMNHEFRDTDLVECLRRLLGKAKLPRR